MNIIICGAGHVGSFAADELARAENNVTVVDKSRQRTRKIEDTLDVRTLIGNCAAAETLRAAGAHNADLLIAATDNDEINLFTAAIAKGVGCKRTIVRVHHRTYFEQHGLDYVGHLGIESLICPEYSTAQAIARTLRNPGALAIENFAKGKIEMQEFEVGEKAAAVGVALMQLGLPPGTRLATITRGDRTFIPEAATVINPGDVVVLVGNADRYEAARKLFREEKAKRQNVVIMGGPPMAVWLCRALHKRDFKVRLFEVNAARAEELANKLEWVTVIQADATDRDVFEDERISQADAFVGLLDDDEHNILGCAWAKSLGVRHAIAVVQRADYLHLMSSVGIDSAFSPRQVAVREIRRAIETGSLRLMTTLAGGEIEVYWVRVGERASLRDKPLREVKLSPDWVIAAVQHGERVTVPSADDVVHAGDTLLAIGRSGAEGKLKKLFAAG